MRQIRYIINPTQILFSHPRRRVRISNADGFSAEVLAMREVVRCGDYIYDHEGD